MFVSIALVLFILLIPPIIRKHSIIRIVNEERGGLFLLLLSKVLFWYYLIELVSVWFPEYKMWYTPSIVLVALMDSYKDKRYLVFPFRKKIMHKRL